MHHFESSLLEEIGRATLWMTAVGLLAGVALRVARIRSPRLHRMVWCAVLLAGWTLYGLSLDVPWLDPPSRIATPDLRAAETHSSWSTSATVTSNDQTATVHNHGWQASGQSLAGESVGAAPKPVETAVANFAWRNFAWMTWIGGLAVVAASMVVGYAWFVTHLPPEISADSAWRDQWHALLAEGGRGDWVRLRVTESTGPLLCRLPRGYELFVPASLWKTLDARQREAILRHELAHWQRGDVWKSLAVRLLALPHWFNPVSWLAVRRFDEAAEWACDREAGGSQPTVYANTLVRLGELVSSRMHLSSAGRGRPLAARIRRVLELHHSDDSPWKKNGLLLAAACVLLLASVRVRLVARETAPLAPQDSMFAEQAAAFDRTANSTAAIDARGLTALPASTAFDVASLDELTVGELTKRAGTELNPIWANAILARLQASAEAGVQRDAALQAIRDYHWTEFQRQQVRAFNRNAGMVDAPAVPRAAMPGASDEERGRFRYSGKTFEQWKELIASNSDPLVRREAIESLPAFALEGYEMEAIGELIQLMRDYSIATFDEGPIGQLKLAAVSAIDRFPRQATTRLLQESLHSDNANQRLFALCMLPVANWQARDWAPHYLDALQDEDPRVRVAARIGAAAIAHESPVLASSLHDGLASGSSAEVISALALVGGVKRSLVGLPNSEATIAPFPTLVSQVADLLAHRDGQVREAAQASLYRLGEAAVAELQRLATSADPVIAAEAQQVLTQLHERPPTPLDLASSWTIRVFPPTGDQTRGADLSDEVSKPNGSDL